MGKRAIHYAGALSYQKSNGYTVKVTGGWAACCYGEKAKQIKKRGLNTYKLPEVTCKTCLMIMRKAGLDVPVRVGWYKIEFPMCDLCRKPAMWAHPAGGFRCFSCPRPNEEQAM